MIQGSKGSVLMPQFTIGIPTYNRAELLKRSIASALDQSAPDVRVIVSDNASPDHTAEVVQSFGDRVEYHRNATNLGATANLEKVFQLASTEYFSWLQDDDVLHRDFVQHALRGFAGADDVAAYACYSVKTPSPTTFYHSFLTGPAVPTGWMQGDMTYLDGILVAPVSLFYSFGNPPALAYRARDLRRAIQTIPHRSLLFDERILLAGTIIDSKVVVDPWPGAIFSDHYDQDYKRIFRENPEARINQWYVLADAVGELLKGRGECWKEPTMAYFRELPIEYRLNWLRYYCPDVNAWRKANPIAREVWPMLIDTISPAERPAFLSQASSNLVPRGRTKELLKDLIPPLLWKAMRKRMQFDT